MDLKNISLHSYLHFDSEQICWFRKHHSIDKFPVENFIATNTAFPAMDILESQKWRED